MTRLAEVVVRSRSSRRPARDPTRFDALAKSLSIASPRRRFLAGLLGGALAGRLGPSATAAKVRGKRRPGQARVAQDLPKPNGQPCVKDAQCRSGVCCGASHGHHGLCAAPATIHECGGRCATPNVPATIPRACGIVACPSCEQCQAQTGCAGSALLGADAPAGTGVYCAQQPVPGLVVSCPCLTPATFCSSGSGGALNDQCVAICAA